MPVVATSQVAAASESMATVPIKQEQPRSGGAEGTSRRHLQGDRQDLSTEHFIRGVVPSTKEVSRYLGLREDHNTGHLNKVVEQKLATPEFFLSEHQVRAPYSLISINCNLFDSVHCQHTATADHRSDKCRNNEN